MKNSSLIIGGFKGIDSLCCFHGYLNEKTLPKQGFLTFNASELLRYVGRSYDGLTAAKAAFSVALGRMTRFTVSRLAW